MQQKPRFSGGIIIAIVLVLALVMVTMYSSLSGSEPSTMAYSDVIEYFENNQVTAFELDLNTGTIELSLKEGDKPLPENALPAGESTGLLQELAGADENYGPQNGGTVLATYRLPYIDFFLSTLRSEGYIEQYNEANPDAPMIYDMTPVRASIPWMEIVLYVVMIGGVAFLFVSMYRSGAGGSGIMNVGRAKVKDQQESQRKATFADVAGAEEEKAELQEVVEFLKAPERFNSLGARIPHGVLLVGPPGTGKTMLAKAVAGEASVPFFSISGSEFVEMFVGMGASKVRDLFKQAKEKAPCIVFIDEIDAIGQKRNSTGTGGNDEREQTLNQLLTEMDGFEGNTGVIILAATNRPESLDPALTRPGRFDRRVPVELPDLAGREAILRVHAKKIKMAQDVDLHTIARMASGASGAELANIINEAALRAVRNGRTIVSQADLEESIEVVIAGYQKKNAVLSDKEKLVVSYHEIGHALVAAKQTNSAPVQKITIIPRTSGALGYTMQVDTGDKYLLTKEEIENKIATYTGGRAAEEVVFGEITTGASNDIEQATKLARAMITRYGMSDEFDMVAMETVNNQYLGGDTSLACSAETQKEIDKKVVELVKKQHEKARQILLDNRAKLDELARFLCEKETITGDEFMEILTSGGNEK